MAEPKPFKIKDREQDVTRVYHPHPITRSRKRALLGVVEELRTIQGDTPEDAPLLLPEDEEERGMRLVCDALNAALKPGKDAPEAGDLLYSQWEADLTPESEIAKHFEDCLELLTDPT